MFKHILFPTDGSPMSERVSQQCLALAHETKAKVTAIYVIPAYHVFAYAPALVSDTPEQYKQASENHARKLLGQVEQAARVTGVQCDTVYVVADQPFEAIVKAAAEHGCDLICMASHGHKGVKGVLLGSQTHKVLTHTDVPVLVYR